MSKTTNKFALGVRVRAVRMVLDHEADPSIPRGSNDFPCGADRVLSPHTVGVGEEGVHSRYGSPRQSRCRLCWRNARRSEEHTSELQSLMRISYAVFCLKKKKITITTSEP